MADNFSTQLAKRANPTESNFSPLSLPNKPLDFSGLKGMNIILDPKTGKVAKTQEEVERALAYNKTPKRPTPLLPPQSKVFTKVPTPLVPPTTISNAKKIDTVAKNNKTLEDISQKGITVDDSGTQRYADGTLLPGNAAYGTPEYYAAIAQANPWLVSQETSMGKTGIQSNVGETGIQSTVPPDVSVEDQQTQDLMNEMKATTDANTKSMIENIQQMFSQRKIEQQDINRRQQAGVQSALLMGGVTGAGSTAQYAPISSQGIISAQENYGLKQLVDLDAQENNLIAQAKAAQSEANYQLMDKKMARIEETRKEKIAQATKLNNDIIEQNKKIREQNLQSQKDYSIASVYQSGVTNPIDIIKSLSQQGITTNLVEVSNAIKNINPDSEKITSLAKTIAEKGAPPDIVQKVLSSNNYNSAVLNSGTWLGTLNPTEKLDFQIKQAELAHKQKQTELLGEPTVAEKKKEETTLKSTQGANQVLQDKIDLAETLKSGVGMTNRVGPNFLARVPSSFWGGVGRLATGVGILSLIKEGVVEATGAGQAFSGGVHRLASNEFLNALISAKQRGATFGALTDREGDALRSAATQLNDWEIKDANGKGLGIWNVSQDEFKKELDRIKTLALTAIERSGGTTLSPEEQTVIDESFSNQTDQPASIYY